MLQKQRGETFSKRQKRSESFLKGNESDHPEAPWWLVVGAVFVLTLVILPSLSFSPCQSLIQISRSWPEIRTGQRGNTPGVQNKLITSLSASPRPPTSFLIKMQIQGRWGDEVLWWSPGSPQGSMGLMMVVMGAQAADDGQTDRR